MIPLFAIELLNCKVITPAATSPPNKQTLKTTSTTRMGSKARSSCATPAAKPKTPTRRHVQSQPTAHAKQRPFLPRKPPLKPQQRPHKREATTTFATSNPTAAASVKASEPLIATCASLEPCSPSAQFSHAHAVSLSDQRHPSADHKAPIQQGPCAPQISLTRALAARSGMEARNLVEAASPVSARQVATASSQRSGASVSL
mmetsp:Transcript_11665/g.33239  ORF Transcript_11665/g.33239 Transcript_11665/m.33239 type:complete len:202 (-) Transcript_11665:349-954(-)